MRERSGSNRNHWKNLPEWQRELEDDSNEELRELHATQNDKESLRDQRLNLEDERRERQQRRLNPDLDDLE